MFSELKFPVPWGHVAAKAWGPSDGHPVLCLHGWLDNANTFDKLIPLLPRDYYYVAMDFSGHGWSSHRPAGSPYHFLDYVSDVRRVVAGGSVAGMFCFLYPEMVDKLILLENLGFLLAPEDTEAWLKSKRIMIDRLLSLEAKQQTPKARSPEAALQRLLEANRHLTAESGAILLQRGATETPAGLVYNRDMRARTQSQEFFTVEQCLKLLRKIQDRVLIIVGHPDLQSGWHNSTASHGRSISQFPTPALGWAAPGAGREQPACLPQDWCCTLRLGLLGARLAEEMLDLSSPQHPTTFCPLTL
nr:serine hydrolase-like protein 2 isoform X3 [Columba livia]